MDPHSLPRRVPGLDRFLPEQPEECIMKNFLKKTFARLMKDEKGVTLVEYGIALVLAVSVGTLALTNLADEVEAEMGQAETILAGD
jgi:Flp pilus assembly pilin Flp